ncbi:hypothetical protein [Meiothermus taiwanensis]|uniref:Uncharacterized protein n=1 Tax=Meiothermus taiwanensis WR-220 TaxID=1339250 RepID=A0ABM6WL22_9DEIN|nr:hypothetical protein [Meiothermus taiwanensis]AWR87818.1 hypothetical protein Mtai_v1c25900 [Meiothermus taiwanensis WR-220]KIQ54177.1 hypothetical protein SY28_09950 [Meiothermus taiwanensis]KZK16236.1 hypothetical protein A3962_06795 [Meiothermus taiwanensis]
MQLRFFLVLAALGFGASGLAQSLSFGLYARLSPDYLTPTVEATLPLEGLELNARFQREALGVGLGGALELGPLGRLSYGARASLGFAGWGLQAAASGVFGPVAASLEAAYSNTLRSSLWVGDEAEGGLKLGLGGRYRLDGRQTLGLQLGFKNSLAGVASGSGELSYALRRQETYTLGLGIDDSRLYGLLGWRGELDEAGTLLEATLRAGQLNRLEAALTTPLDEDLLNYLKLRLTVAYPWAATLGVEAYGFRVDAGYDGGFSLWLRYRLSFGGNE